MKIKCFQIKLRSLKDISSKCFLATAFDGSEAFIPKSQYFGCDGSGHWISAWILERKDLQYSTKKSAMFDRDTGRMMPEVTYKRHVPSKITPVESSPDKNLLR